MRLRFEGIPRPVSFQGCDALLPFLKPPLAAWPHTLANAEAVHPVLTVARTAAGYRVTTCVHDTTSYDYVDAYEAVAGFFAELYTAFIVANPDLLCIHAAALRFKKGLFVFPASGKAGKSTLAVHGAAAGAVFFTDDVLPIRDSEGLGVSLGMAPRLRLPLPANVTADFRAFLKDRAVLENSYGKFVGLKPGEIASFGSAAPIVAIVLLDRVEDGPPILEEIGKSEVLRDLMRRNFTQGIDAEAKVQRLLQIAKSGTCYRLRYATCDSGLALLRDMS